MKTFVHSKLYDYVLDLHFCYVGDINIQVLKVVEVWHLHYFLVSLHSILSVLVIFDKIRFPHFSLYPNYKPSLWFLNWKLIPHHLFLKSNLVESSQILDFIGHEHISLAVIRDHVVYCKMTPNPFNPSDQSMLFSFATDGIHGQDCGLFRNQRFGINLRTYFYHNAMNVNHIFLDRSMSSSNFVYQTGYNSFSTSMTLFYHDNNILN